MQQGGLLSMLLLNDNESWWWKNGLKIQSNFWSSWKTVLLRFCSLNSWVRHCFRHCYSNRKAEVWSLNLCQIEGKVIWGIIVFNVTFSLEFYNSYTIVSVPIYFKVSQSPSSQQFPHQSLPQSFYENKCKKWLCSSMCGDRTNVFASFISCWDATGESADSSTNSARVTKFG